MSAVPTPPNPAWGNVFGNVGLQGTDFDNPISSTGFYFAFLSKADLNQTTNKWDILFEVVPEPWFLNVFVNGSQGVKITAPTGPASLYHIPEVDEAPLLAMLGLKTTDTLAEGSWYRIQLQKQESGIINGALYDPDIDMEKT